MKRIPGSRLATSAVIGALLLVVFGIAAPVIAQPTSPFQVRVTGTCPVGSSIRQINADGTVVCQADTNSGTVTSVGTGPGLTGGPITSTGTISIAAGGVTSTHIMDGTVGAADVSAAQVQLRVTGICPAGAAIQAVAESGAVTCETAGSGTVTAVSASAPLLSSGGTTPNISLPHVIIDAAAPFNTAIGSSALQNNTSGFNNTASGAGALLSNTIGRHNTASGFSVLQNNISGESNTASGAFALFSNIHGTSNTASGGSALFSNTTGAANTASGVNALVNNTTGEFNTASGVGALEDNTTGSFNAAIGRFALAGNTTGSFNTAIGFAAGVSSGDLTNATAIGTGAVVDASDKIRLGNGAVTVIEAQVGLTTVSDKAKKENFQPVDGEEVLRKLRSLTLTSWNYIGQDARQFRHYGPVSQEFFAAFGHDGVGTIGTPTTITSTDVTGVLMSAVQTLEKRTAALQQETELLRETVAALKAQNAELRARFEAAEKPAAIKEAIAQR